MFNCNPKKLGRMIAPRTKVTVFLLNRKDLFAKEFFLLSVVVVVVADVGLRFANICYER
jgi:hypothetical protein